MITNGGKSKTYVINAIIHYSLLSTFFVIVIIHWKTGTCQVIKPAMRSQIYIQQKDNSSCTL